MLEVFITERLKLASEGYATGDRFELKVCEVYTFDQQAKKCSTPCCHIAPWARQGVAFPQLGQQHEIRSMPPAHQPHCLPRCAGGGAQRAAGRAHRGGGAAHCSGWLQGPAGQPAAQGGGGGEAGQRRAGGLHQACGGQPAGGGLGWVSGRHAGMGKGRA